MIHIDFDPNKLTPALKAEWEALQTEIKETTVALIQKWESTHQLSATDLEDTIWRKINAWLKEHVFHGKCAYCETHLESARQTGDAEHYRPKLKVNYKAAPDKPYVTPQAENEQAQMINHPGYFWLAYHWKNLLPSCKFCNAVEGKKSQFPTRNAHVIVRRLKPEELHQLRHTPYESPTQLGVYYLQPDDLDAIEEPMLLHPYKDRPEDHLAFDEFGGVTARPTPAPSPAKGEASINTYNLKGPGLVISRRQAQLNAEMLFDSAFNYFHKIRELPLFEAQQKATKEPKIAMILEGKSAYSAAQVAYLKLARRL
jgi:hypothetical protein